jgi:hypothetical protein
MLVIERRNPLMGRCLRFETGDGVYGFDGGVVICMEG